MPSQRQDFKACLCQTSPHPIGLEIDRAEGVYLYTKDGKRYLDFISGIGVANIGHTHPAVVAAIETQARKYLHVMVYGEYILDPQVALAKKLTALLPDRLNQVYFTNSGTEANEGALKLAKKWTGRTKLVSFEGSFHGDTHGACSVTGREIYRTPFEPLLPEVSFLPFDDVDRLGEIDECVAAVITEPIQGEGGIRIPSNRFMTALRKRCDEVGALLIFDEAQTGFGRTGKLFAMEHWHSGQENLAQENLAQGNVVPDIVTFAKAIGGGMPLGAFVSSREIMQTFSSNPPFSHVTTFGGHPVSCAAALASLNVILAQDLPARATKLGRLIRKRLESLAEQGAPIRDVRGKGLMIGLELESPEVAQRFVTAAFDAGLILGWTLHTETVIRIMPPLILSEAEMETALEIMALALEKI